MQRCRAPEAVSLKFETIECRPPSPAQKPEATAPRAPPPAPLLQLSSAHVKIPLQGGLPRQSQQDGHLITASRTPGQERLIAGTLRQSHGESRGSKRLSSSQSKANCHQG